MPHNDGVDGHVADKLRGMLHDKRQRVGRHPEVVIVRIVVGGVKRDGVHLLCRRHPGIGGLRHLVVTGEREE